MDIDTDTPKTGHARNTAAAVAWLEPKLKLKLKLKPNGSVSTKRNQEQLKMNTEISSLETAVLGGGCFWCVEAALKDLRGVLSVTPGYCGGHVEQPSYEQVCGKQTGHVEVVQVRFDASLLAYADLLRLFFAAHDPTTPERQGEDRGPQYASTIFWQSDAQRVQAQAVIAELERDKVFGAPIVTALREPAHFWPAEIYHHDYFARNPQQAYCQMVIAPKVAKLRQAFKARFQ